MQAIELIHRMRRLILEELETSRSRWVLGRDVYQTLTQARDEQGGYVLATCRDGSQFTILGLPFVVVSRAGTLLLESLEEVGRG